MNKLLFQIQEQKEQFASALSEVINLEKLEEIRTSFLGRKGSITNLITLLKDLSIEEKKIYGPQLNNLKHEAQESYLKKQAEIVEEHTRKKLEKERFFDVTASFLQPLKGSLHPYTLIIQDLEDIFITMGFEIADGPEVETDYYNFSALNIAKDHPARDMHDTFWLQNIQDLLLRTHTSTVQIHAMEHKKLPLAVFAPGRVYRNEATDASHDFMFMQGECLYIDKNVSMAHLLSTAQTFLKAIFQKEDLSIRVRPGYFPFVEPGVEIDAQCPFCKKGCSICKHTTWIELLGAGLVHPNVLKAGGIDTSIYRGFAFGFGISRIAMIKYGITDVRLFHSNKIEFLNQFSHII